MVAVTLYAKFFTTVVVLPFTSFSVRLVLAYTGTCPSLEEVSSFTVTTNELLATVASESSLVSTYEAVSSKSELLKTTFTLFEEVEEIVVSVLADFTNDWMSCLGTTNFPYASTDSAMFPVMTVVAFPKTLKAKVWSVATLFTVVPSVSYLYAEMVQE